MSDTNGMLLAQPHGTQRSAYPAGSGPGRHDLDALLVAMERGDRASATTQAFTLVESGIAFERILLDLLAPALVEVGTRWERHDWSVAEEHTATAVGDAVLAALALRQPMPEPRGRVAVACVDGDWHALAARIVAEILAARGWTVIFLGASCPIDGLQRQLLAVEADALLLSCSMPALLPAAARAVQAARAVEVPVLAGGRGFGADGLRARSLGTSGWAATPAAADALLELWRGNPPTDTPALVHASGELEDLEHRRDELVASAFDGLLLTRLAVGGEAHRSLIRDVLDLTVRTLAAALLLNDERILIDQMDWSRRVLIARDLPGDLLDDSLEALAAATDDRLPRSASLLDLVSRR